MSPPPAEQLAARIFMGPALRAQPDRRLVDLVRGGYEAAFEEIVRRYRKPLDRFAAGIVGGRAEDVTQDSFSKALLALRGSEAEIELRPWLYRIVRNTALNDLRDRAPVTEELSERLPGARSAAAEVEAREDLRDLMERLQALPEPQRAALVMRELEGLSHEEIAAALGVSGGAARQAIFRARAALREGFGLLVPLPALRALAEHGGDAGRAGRAVAAGASSAGGAALGGGALKVGMATVLIAGTVGAGVAIENHRGARPGPEAAEAAPLVGDRHAGAGASAGSTQQSGPSEGERPQGSGGGDRHGSSGQDGGGSVEATHGGPDGGPETSGGSHSGGTSHSGSSGGSGEGPRNSGSGGSGSEDSGSGSADRHGSSSGSDDSSGSSSGSGSSDDGGGSSGSSGGDDSLSGGEGGGSDTGGDGGAIESEPTGEPAMGEGSEDGGGSSSGGDGSGDGTSTSGDTSGTSGSDGSP